MILPIGLCGRFFVSDGRPACVDSMRSASLLLSVLARGPASGVLPRSACGAPLGASRGYLWAPLWSSSSSTGSSFSVPGFPPIVIVMPIALHNSSARSMVGRYPLRSDRNASVGSRASLATSCPLRPRFVSSLSMRCTRRSVAVLLIFRLVVATSVFSPCSGASSADSYLALLAFQDRSAVRFPPVFRPRFSPPTGAALDRLPPSVPVG